MPKRQLKPRVIAGDKCLWVATAETWEEAQQIMASLRYYLCESNPSGGYDVFVRIQKV